MPASVHHTASQVHGAAAVLGRAFRTDPGFIYAIPDAQRRDSVVQRLFLAYLRYTVVYGEVWRTSGTVAGIAGWLPPTNPFPSVDGMVAAGIGDAITGCSPAEVHRLQRVSSSVDALHVHVTPQPHYYLFFIGVEEGLQGKGIGSTLLHAGLQRADMDGVPCHLNTLTETNVRFYERHGFTVIETSALPGSNVQIWAMRREPQNRAKRLAWPWKRPKWVLEQIS